MGLLIPACRSPHPEMPPGKSALGRQQAAPSSTQLSATLAPRKTNPLPASSKFSLCPRSRSPSLQQVGAFPGATPLRSGVCAPAIPDAWRPVLGSPGREWGGRGPRNPSVQIIISPAPWMRRGLHLSLSNPQLLQSVSEPRRVEEPN